MLLPMSPEANMVFTLLALKRSSMASDECPPAPNLC